MNPLRLRLRNYRCFADLDLQLPDGRVAILGANGAGKSSIVNAVEFALFGAESRSLADALMEDSDGELLVELEFEHAGGLYRVRRTYSAKGRGKATLDLEECNLDPPWGPILPTDWQPLTRESAKATQERVEQVLGLSRQTFRASAFLQQGDGAAFTEAQPRDRKQILGEVLGLGRYDRLRARAHTDKRTLETQLQLLAGRTQQAEEEAALLPMLERSHQDAVEAAMVHADTVADLDRAAAEAAADLDAAREKAAAREVAEAALREARANDQRVGDLCAAATEAQRTIEAARDELATLAGLEQLAVAEQALVDLDAAEQAWQDAQRLTLDRDRLLGDAADWRERAQERLLMASNVLSSVGSDSCETCGQLLGADAAAHSARTYRKAAASFDAEALLLAAKASAIVVPAVDRPDTEALNGIRASVTRCRGDQQQRSRLEERIDAAEKALPGPAAGEIAANQAQLTAALDRVAALGEAPALGHLHAQQAYVADQLKAARAALEQQRLAAARIDERLQVAKKAAESLAVARIERKELGESLQVVAGVERACSPDGIPALIVENTAIPYLEAEAARILSDLGTSYRVELRTQAALKSGDGLRDTLDVVVLTDAGERAYETFSGGERTRINLALRIALARLLAHRRGAESRLLCIDEPEFLDEQGTAALVDVLGSLEADFDKLYIVSHVPGLRDSFDTTLSVVSGEHGSRVVDDDEGFDAVAVAA